ncbi:MAG: hypothetical protein COB73_04135 [Flavobacteriaceae bacterium]|nr:MAG: hypothetical protein COB73_04135 [Flavobacteriaceae bacterium]
MLVQKELKIKGMVCPRCLSTVRDQLQNLGATVLNLKLGTALIEFQENSISDDLIKRTLKLSGFELLTDDESKIIENIKLVLRQIVDDTPIVLKENLSERLVFNFDKDYTFLSKLFSRIEATTIEKYFTQLKIILVTT